ncbi:MAG: hypothetical protein EBR00_11290 [Gammaproteobacteria bacterium]|nr:hypothetical protein [Gammaproteobacteria bacterium]
MKLPRLIGLYSPAPGCGKTTVANLLIEHQRVSFAAPLKRAVSHMLNELGLPGFYAYTDKEAIIPGLDVSARHMMQTLGTEWGRACIHPDFWVMIARAKTQRIMGDGRSVVIDDVRFPNEAAMVFALGGELWRIDRPGVSYSGDHSSEGGLEDITPDRVIVNDGTITQLKEKIYG